MNMHQDLEKTVEDVLCGDLGRYEDLIRLLQGDIWKVVATGRFDYATSQDIVQQTFVNAYLHLDQFERGREFAAWIKGIARNLMRQEMRKMGTRGRLMTVYQEHVETVLNGENVGDREDRRLAALRECLAQLPPRHRRVVELHYEQALPLSRMAEMLDSSPAAAKQLLWRARLLLKKCVEMKEAQP